ncbi:DUF6624 domain-containing protein [Fibrella aquatilis]|uniref:Tetratricopeptide repeat protein n=1 Tax=Fibrella aquatilis TaxID=2817059 RepID=A0A939GC37_9BACT|nr:DUF6624 domain-containing protein [Fibrella aquatilis]MBO0934820.1 hypothetical protein [Fibrella aquatilis]
MKRLLLISLICLLSSLYTCAQQTYAIKDTAYKQAVEDALLSLKKSDYQACLNQYKRAFDLSQKSALSTLRAAVCAYQCGQTEQAYNFIQKAIALDWWVSEDVWKNKTEYPEVNSLRVGALYAFFQQELDKQKIAVGLDPTLERELEQIFHADNQPRLHADTLAKQYGYNSPNVQPIYAEMRKADSINLIKIEHIFNKYGYPGRKLVGDKQSITAWLVIQHASLELQEKYLPIMEKAAATGELDKSSFALQLCAT